MKKLAYLKAPRFGDTTDYPIQVWSASWPRKASPPTARSPSSRSFSPARSSPSSAWFAISRARASAYVLPMLHCSEYRLFPASYLHECIPYTMDVWPWSYARWEGFIRRNRIRTWFITARRSAEIFKQKFPDRNMPLAARGRRSRRISPRHPARPATTIHVLELGRRWEDYHAKIEDSLKSRNQTHLYQQAEGRIIFATRQALIDGFVNSIVSVCFPQSVTHPERRRRRNCHAAILRDDGLQVRARRPGAAGADRHLRVQSHDRS